MKYSGLFLKMTTACASPLLVAAICSPESQNACREHLLRLQRLDFSAVTDFYLLDLRIAEVVCDNSPDGLFAAGVSVRVDGMPVSTGGVIGSPRQKILSAEDVEAEDLGNGLSLLSFAGGPGLLAACPLDTATRLYRSLENINDPKDRSLFILSALSKLSVDTFMLVQDGSGPRNQENIFFSLDGKILSEL